MIVFPDLVNNPYSPPEQNPSATTLYRMPFKLPAPGQMAMKAGDCLSSPARLAWEETEGRRNGGQQN